MGKGEQFEKKSIRRFGYLRKPSSVMIYTYRRYCINTGWMADGDRSREVKVRREQRGREIKINITTVEQNTTSCNDTNK